MSKVVSYILILRNVAFTLICLVCHLPVATLYIYKSIVTWLASKFRKHLNPMTAIDYLVTVTLDIGVSDRKSKNINSNIGITCKLNGKVDGESFFESFEKNVINMDYSQDLDPQHPHIRFHKSIARFGGYWFYKTFPNRLKYEDHVTCANLKNNSSFEEEVCNWLKIRYDVDKCPLWRILLLYREESHDTIFVFKIHHTLADGYSLMHILDLLTNTQFKYQVRDFKDSNWEKFKILTETSYNIVKHNIKLSFVPVSPLQKMKNSELFMTNLSLPLSTIKNIRKSANVRFQSVMLHLVLNYIQSLILNTTEEGNETPDQVIITNSLPWPKHARNELCNHATGATFAFKTGGKENPEQMESLAGVNHIFEDFYDKHLDRGVHELSQPLASVPLYFYDFDFLRNRVGGKLSAYYVHLIGSEEYSQVFGYECSDVHMFCSPPNQKGVTITCITTSNEVKICILGPNTLFPSQEKADAFLKENIEKHIAKLSERNDFC